MREHAPEVPEEGRGVPRTRVLARRARTTSLRLQRGIAWRVRPSSFPRPEAAGPIDRYPHRWYEHRTPLRRSDAGADPVLEAGKVANIRLAAPALDGLRVAPGAVVSFWRAVGPLRARDGYRHGMELRGGCVVPALGGGICLLSNALFRAAASVGWTIVERHGHTMEAVPPSPDEVWGVDATVSWPAFDLRFRALDGDPPARLGGAVEGDELVVRIHAAAPLRREVALANDGDRVEVVAGQSIRRGRLVRRVDGVEEEFGTNARRLLRDGELGRSCLTCGLTGCAARVEVPLGERPPAP